MYGVWFYLFFWGLAVFFAFPVVLLGLVKVAFSKPKVSLSVSVLENALLRMRDKNDFEKILKTFVRNFRTLSPRNDSEGRLNLIEKLCVHEFLDDVEKFKKDLIKANPKLKEAIENTIETALKNHKKR